MQKFEPDQLVLVKYAGNTIWRLRRYSFCDGVHHETQDGSLWDDNQIMPYSGNEHMLGDIRKHPKKWEPTPGRGRCGMVQQQIFITMPGVSTPYDTPSRHWWEANKVEG